MEKKTPHYKLSIVKALIQEGRVRVTKSALAGSRALGFNPDEIINILMTLMPEDFYKSMTTYADHRVWQDVYHPATKAGEVYLKLTVIDYVLIVSFKER